MSWFLTLGSTVPAAIVLLFLGIALLAASLACLWLFDLRTCRGGEERIRAYDRYVSEQEAEVLVADQKLPVRTARLFLFLLVFYGLFVAAYVGLRFAWTWADEDAIRLTNYSQNLYTDGTLLSQRGAYPLGYAYSSLNSFLAHLTGLSVNTLQVYVQPFLITLLIAVALAAFQNLTGDRATALLASLLLFLQPEFLFESLRSSHAKVTWLLALTMLFILAHSFQERRRGRTITRWVLLFYLVAFSLIACNTFFASSYLFGIAFAFAGAWALPRWGVGNRPYSGLARLRYVVLSCAILFFIFVFYMYRPVLVQVHQLKNAVDRLATLLLGAGIAANPYSPVESTWRYPGLYPLLTLFNWLVLVLSLVSWLQKAHTLLVRRKLIPPHQLLMWLFYIAFSLILMVSVLLDLAGALSANLQVRVFPHFMIFAIPMASDLLVQVARRLNLQNYLLRAALVTVLFGCAFYLSGVSLLKATNEPLLNNTPWFHTVGERLAITWEEDHLQDASVWVGTGRRLGPITNNLASWTERGLEATWYTPPVYDRNILVSEPIIALAIRNHLPMPDVFRYQRVYDGGSVQLYHEPR